MAIGQTDWMINLRAVILTALTAFVALCGAPSAAQFNNSNNGTSLASYKTNMQSVITAAMPYGTVWLMVGAPSNTGQATAVLPAFIAVLEELIVTNGLPPLNAIQ